MRENEGVKSYGIPNQDSWIKYTAGIPINAEGMLPAIKPYDFKEK